MYQVKHLVIGGGAVGLACAARLARKVRFCDLRRISCSKSIFLQIRNAKLILLHLKKIISRRFDALFSLRLAQPHKMRVKFLHQISFWSQALSDNRYRELRFDALTRFYHQKKNPQGPTLLLEKNARVGEETSSRNSEVIHAGLYYPEKSLKTRLCIEGRQMLYRLSERRSQQIDSRKVGKVIFSTEPDDPSGYLQKLRVKGDSLGIPTRFLGSRELASLEPNLRASCALLSPETGIIDSHGLMLLLKGLISDRGSDLATRSCVKSISHRPGRGFTVEVCDEAGNATAIDSEYVINTAGLNADRIARLAMGDSTPEAYKIHYLKGYYFSYQGQSLVSRLTYPIPDSNLKSLGIHTTLDLSGRSEQREFLDSDQLLRINLYTLFPNLE